MHYKNLNFNSCIIKISQNIFAPTVFVIRLLQLIRDFDSNSCRLREIFPTAIGLLNRSYDLLSQTEIVLKLVINGNQPNNFLSVL